MLEFKSSLLVTSDELSLADIESVLGKPSRAFSKGDTYSKIPKIRTYTRWQLTSTISPKDKFEVHLADIVDFLARNENGISKLRKTCRIHVFCMLSTDDGQGAAVIPSSTMAELSKYDVDVVLDVYGTPNT